MAYYGACNAAVFVTAPAVIAVVTFAVYTIDNEMTASKVHKGESAGGGGRRW